SLTGAFAGRRAAADSPPSPLPGELCSSGDEYDRGQGGFPRGGPPVRRRRSAPSVLVVFSPACPIPLTQVITRRSRPASPGRGIGCSCYRRGDGRRPRPGDGLRRDLPALQEAVPAGAADRRGRA